MFVPHHLNSYNIKSILIDRSMVSVYARFHVPIFGDNFISKQNMHIREMSVDCLILQLKYGKCELFHYF